MLKKQWYDIVAPEMFGSVVVGETPAADPAGLSGRVVEVSLMEISRDFQKFYIKLIFKVTSVDGNRALTKFVGHDCVYERISRMVQRHSRRVDIVQDVATKDGAKLRAKTIFILRKRVNNSIKSAARKVAKEMIEKAAAGSTLQELIESIIKGDLQLIVKKQCSRIYPVTNIEIRKTEMLSDPVTTELANKPKKAKAKPV